MDSSALMIIQSITIIACLVVLFLLLNRDIRLQQRQISYVFFGIILSDIALLVEVASQGNLEVMLVGKAIYAIGLGFYMLSLMILCACLCGVRLPIIFTGTLLGMECVLVSFYILRVNRSLFYYNLELAQIGDYQYLQCEYGPLSHLYWIICVSIPCIVDMFLLVREARRNKGRRHETVSLIIIVMGIGSISILHKLGVITPWYDPSMLIASYVFIYLVFSRWKYQGIDVVAAAAQTAIDNISGGVITLNQYKEIIYFNEAAKQVIPELTLFEGKSIDYLDNIVLPETIDGGQTEISYNGKTYYITINEIKDDGSQIIGYAIMFNDMTDMYALMEQIKEERRRADEASYAKSQFVANISHEIRTPMNAIMGLSDLIIEESRGRKVYDMAVTIKKAANSLLDLVNNILDMSKLESGKMELTESEYSIQTMVLDVMKVMEIPAAQHGLSLKCNIDQSLPCVLFGDDGKIRQCLINLINNGIKFTDKGYVRVDVSGIRREDKVTVTFMVMDTGVGIKDEDMERLFGAFEQVDLIKNKGKEGSGLGLSITKQLVELMGGIIDVSSIYGAGTTFTIRISQRIVNGTPISEVKEIVDNAAQDTKMFVAPGMKVLLVDDNRVNLMVAKGFLVPYMLQIDTADSGEEAIEMVKNKNYNIILMDHMMPGMDGVEAVGIIREFYEKKNVTPYYIALTANAFGNIKQMFLTHGFNDFLSKPIEKKKLHEILLRAVPDDFRNFVDTVLEEDEYTEDEMAELFMEGVDVRGAFKNHGCKQEEYVELIELFALEGAQKIQLIMQTYVDRDWKNYSIHTHGLKSAAINIGAVNLSEQAKKHEFASKDENELDIDFIDEDYQALVNNYQHIIDETSRVVEKYRAAHKEISDVSMPSLEKDELIQRVQDALSLSEDFKSKEAAEVIEEILSHSLEPDVEKKLSDIKMKYKLYDDDGAEELLHQLEDMLTK